MTEKELHKLSRQDLLRLLLAQSKEVARQKNRIEELTTAYGQERELTNRLKAKLDEKDATAEHLNRRLDAIDGTMNKLKAEMAEILQEVKHLRVRLDEKDMALDSACARPDTLLPETGARSVPVKAETGSDEAAGEAAERLAYLKELLAQHEALSKKLRKEQA